MSGKVYKLETRKKRNTQIKGKTKWNWRKRRPSQKVAWRNEFTFAFLNPLTDLFTWRDTPLPGPATARPCFLLLSSFLPLLSLLYFRVSSSPPLHIILSDFALSTSSCASPYSPFSFFFFHSLSSPSLLLHLLLRYLFFTAFFFCLLLLSILLLLFCFASSIRIYSLLPSTI